MEDLLFHAEAPVALGFLLTMLGQLRSSRALADSDAVAALDRALALLGRSDAAAPFPGSAESARIAQVMAADLARSDPPSPGILREIARLARRVGCEAALRAAAAGSSDRLGEIRVRYAPVELASEVRQFCQAFAPLAEHRQLELRVETPPTLTAEVDVAMLRAVTVNLVVNAFHHCSAGGRIECRLAESPVQGEIILQATDSGSVLPDSLIDDLFADGSSLCLGMLASSVDSARGLGPSRSLVALHGGTLELVHNATGRVTFEARFPRWAMRGATVSPEPVDEPSQVVERAVRTTAASLRTRDAYAKQMETELERQQQDLERTLVELARARGEAERASQIKSKFLRMMSHELKTPITTIQLHLRVLQRDSEVPHSARLHAGLDRISRSTRRLLYLVDTALAWARVGDGRCRPAAEAVEGVDLVAEVAQELESYARQKNLSLAVVPTSPSAAIRTDRRLLQLLVAGLVSRAVQVSERGTVSVAVGLDADELVVSVSDSAPPIGPDCRELIFEALSEEPHHVAGPGYGLGLHVVRDLAHALHGEVRLDATTAAGNTLTLRLPDVPCETDDDGQPLAGGRT